MASVRSESSRRTPPDNDRATPPRDGPGRAAPRSAAPSCFEPRQGGTYAATPPLPVRLTRSLTASTTRSLRLSPSSAAWAAAARCKAASSRSPTRPEYGRSAPSHSQRKWRGSLQRWRGDPLPIRRRSRPRSRGRHGGRRHDRKDVVVDVVRDGGGVPSVGHRPCGVGQVRSPCSRTSTRTDPS